MALAKVGRKIKRTGKAAVQFKFTATFEYIDLECTGSWRPEDVKVVWQRSHRKIESNAVKWRVVADRGPEGATGRGLFDPPIAVALIITLYREAKSTEFEEKEYKFYIENQGVAGKKILASFHCNMADYAGIPNTRSALELDCKPVSKKIRKAHLGVTLESEYIKEGASNDSDMQSTYSHMTAMGEDHSVREDVSDDEGDSSPPVASKIPTTTNGNLSSEKSPPVNGKVSNSTSEKSKEKHSKQGTPDSQDMMESVNVEVLSKWLPPSTQLVDAKNQPVPMETLYRAKVFGLYFTAMWCPPCRKFIPKLVKFNDILKENNARFSVMYVSSDHTEEDMLEHLQSNNVSFPAVKFTDPTAEKLREKFGIRQVPHLMIIDSSGKIIDDGARKVVEVATSTAAAMNCYGKWLQGEPAPREKKGPRVGLFSRGGGKKAESVDEKLKSPKESPSELSSIDSHLSVVTSQNSTSSNRIRVESQMKSSVDAARESNLLAELEKKDGIIKDLEVRNEALEQRVTDLSEENIKLKDTIEEQQKKLQEIKTAQTTLLEEKENIVAKASIRGFLLKRGVRGPTGRLWRRRYFRTDQSGRLCYYKFAEDSSPQGFIDLQSVVDVRVSPAGRQDKTECTFEVIVEGRTYELLAMDKTEMDKWIDAIKYLSQWHRKNVGTFRDSPAANS
jgi:thiol-disulfide isomerase/thioredoxin